MYDAEVCQMKVRDESWNRARCYVRELGLDLNYLADVVETNNDEYQPTFSL